MVVGRPVDFENLFVGSLGRIEIDLEGFGVIAEAVVGWVLEGAAGVADAGANDARQSPKLGLRLPKSAKREGRRLEFLRSVLIRGWQGARRLLGLRRHQGHAHTAHQDDGNRDR